MFEYLIEYTVLVHLVVPLGILHLDYFTTS